METMQQQAEERLDDEARLTIATVSDLLDIPIPTIRSWERRYGFPTPARTQGKHRRYSVAEADQLRLLRDEIARGHTSLVIAKARPTPASFAAWPSSACFRRPSRACSI